MSDQQPDALPSWVERMVPNIGSVPADAEATLRRAVAEVMAVQDVTTATQKMPMRFRGTLTMAAEEAFRRLRPQFEAVGHTPLLRRENGMDAIHALQGVFGKEPSKPSRLGLGLLVATIVSVFLVGFSGSFDIVNYVLLKMGRSPAELTIICKKVLADYPSLIPTDAMFRDALVTGALFTLAILGILGTHEMGHYIVARLNKVFTTIPYFIPMPFSPFGTLGAVIVMREPAPNRRVQFDIGIAGPLAGLIVALPVLYLGLRASTVRTLSDVLAQYPASLRPFVPLMQEGQSLLYLAMKYLVFGRILPQGNLDVWITPVAFAAWAGLLVTALNLMPAGQLDGGHVIYGLFGEKARKLHWPLIGVLAIMTIAGFLRENNIIDLGFGWSGWVLWILIIYYLMRNPAPVLDEITGLDTKRKLLGLLTLVIFVLIFTPIPLVQTIPACPQAPAQAPTAMLLQHLFM